MSNPANDIKSLFQSIGKNPEDYQDILKKENLNAAVKRWPLIDAVESIGKIDPTMSSIAKTPLAEVTLEPQVAAVTQAQGDTQPPVSTVTQPLAPKVTQTQTLTQPQLQRTTKNELTLIFERLAADEIKQNPGELIRKNFMAGLR